MSTDATAIVYLLHGLGRTCWCMSWMGHRLRRAGFAVRPWRYHSTRRGTQHHAERFAGELQRADSDPHVSTIHCVTHSMGGIVVRAALNRGVPRKMGRVVMLAPPNGGSYVARALAPYLTWLLSPLPELSCDPDSLVCRLPAPAGVEVGIVAARRDIQVKVHQTHLPGQRAHVIVPGGHMFIMNRRDVFRQTLCFLREGRFV